MPVKKPSFRPRPKVVGLQPATLIKTIFSQAYFNFFTTGVELI